MTADSDHHHENGGPRRVSDPDPDHFLAVGAISIRGRHAMFLFIVSVVVMQAAFLAQEQRDLVGRARNNTVATHLDHSHDDARLAIRHFSDDASFLSWLTPPQPVALALTEWERASMAENATDRVCRPPPGTPTRCCLGSSSAGGGMFFDADTCRNHLDVHTRAANYTLEYLELHRPALPGRFPIATLESQVATGEDQFSTNRRLVHGLRRDRHLHVNGTADSRKLRRRKSSYTTSVISQLSTWPTQDCDLCRVVDYLMVYNWTLAIQGDSLSRQTFAGLECELRRRGYVLTMRDDRPTYRPKEYGWRYGITGATTMTVSLPPPAVVADNDPSVVPPPPRTGTLVFYDMYRPARDNVQIDYIVRHSDIVVFDHGLHWQPKVAHEYQAAMTTLLRAFQHNRTEDDRQQDRQGHDYTENMTEFFLSPSSAAATAVPDHRLQLVAWRQTTAQHFPTVGGHYRGADFQAQCVPIKGDPEGFRWPRMQAAAKATNFTIVNALDPHFPSLPRGSANELVLLPYREYTSSLYYLHPNECAHYCHDPYIWLPIWRSLRIALDRTVRLNEEERIGNTRR